MPINATACRIGKWISVGARSSLGVSNATVLVLEYWRYMQSTYSSGLGRVVNRGGRVQYSSRGLEAWTTVLENLGTEYCVALLPGQVKRQSIDRMQQRCVQKHQPVRY